MSQDVITGYGHCKTCSRMLIKGPDGTFCPSCAIAAPVINSKLNNNHIPYPGKAEFDRVLAASGTAAQSSPAAQAPAKPAASPTDPYGQCIDILRTVPLPPDVKMYKKLQKLITTLEELKANGQ